MIISHGRRYIFVHIPKTAGTSMAAALEARAMKDDILIGDTPKALRRRRRLEGLSARGRIWKHMTLSDAEGIVTVDEMAAYFVFTLVRNPWDRMVSYYHWLKDQQFDHPAVALAQAKDFSGFLHAEATAASLRAAPFESYVTGPDGKALCNAYIRLEHLRDDLAPLEAHLGFTLDIPHLNLSERPGDYRQAYSDADAARVAEICSTDITRFGYAF